MKMKQYSGNDNGNGIEEDCDLIFASAWPAIKSIRGKTFDIKSEVYKSLTPGQRALLMFQVLRGHMGDGAGTFFNLTYLLCKVEVWRELKTAMRRFGNEAMAELISDMEREYNRIQGGEEDKERIRLIDERMARLLPDAEKTVCAYIRTHREEFGEDES